MKRTGGTGTFDALPSGQVRGRIRIAGQRPIQVLGREHVDEAGETVTALEDAKQLLLAARELVEEARISTGDDRTFRGLAAQLIESKKARNVRGVGAVQASISHALTARWAGWPPERITVQHIDSFIVDLMKMQIVRGRKTKTIEPSTAALVVSVIAQVFNFGIKKGLLTFNPATHANRPVIDPATVHYFTPDQQRILMTGEADEDLRLPVLFALGTGLREGEQATIHLSDLKVDGDQPRVIVRYGSRVKGKLYPPKSRRVRPVPLFGVGLEAARRWLELLPAFCPNNLHGLLFPQANGRFRAAKEMLGSVRRGKEARLSRWYVLLDDLKLPRMTWHVLRHTCATSLGAGWWGRRWIIDEIAQLLGHTEDQTTRIYRHLIDDALSGSAAATSGLVTDWSRDRKALQISGYRAAETSTRSSSRPSSR